MDVVLDAMPAAAGLYARALAPARRPDVSQGLPQTTVRLAGHRCTVAEVAAYDSVCGFVLADELPATWLHVLTFPLQLTLMTAADFPLAPLGMVPELELRELDYISFQTDPLASNRIYCFNIDLGFTASSYSMKEE